MKNTTSTSTNQVITAAEAAFGERRFLLEFEENCRRSDGVPGPKGRNIRVRNWDAFRSTGDEWDRYWRIIRPVSNLGEKDGPKNSWVRFTIPLNRKERLLIEAGACSRVRRLQRSGFDTEPITLGEIQSRVVDRGLLDGKAGQQVVVAFYSPTGWHIDAVNWAAQTGSASRIVFLVCSERDGTAGPFGNATARAFAPLFGGCGKDPELEAAESALDKMIVGNYYVAAYHLAEVAGCSANVAEEAIRVYADKSPVWVTDSIENVGTVIRRRIEQ